MNIKSIIKEAQKVSSEFQLSFILCDRTDNIVNIRLYIDVNTFIQVYANQLKEKVNLNLILRGERLYGTDMEGGRYHIHPLENPEKHLFTEERKTIRDFVIEALKFLNKQGLL
ncbi:MAG: hypothetical protein STSR0004_22350 [Peptococcaceae bacterium]